MFHVMLPFDGSDHARKAVDYVIAMSPRHGPIRVTLLNVQTLPYMHGSATEVALTDNIGRSVIAAGERLLVEPRDRLRAAGCEVVTVVKVDDPAKAIVEQTVADGCDAIVMGTRGQGRFGEETLGSVSYKTLHRSKVPVTLVK